jgi:DNA-binding NtrC family response regulator
VIALSLPPLRERREDIPLLADFFLKRACQSSQKGPMNLSRAAVDHLVRYHWPGNIRELRNLIERAVVLAASKEIQPHDLPLLPPTGAPEEGPSTGRSYHDAIRAYQKKVIRETLQASGGNHSKAAELLGLQRTYLSRLIKKLLIKENKE